MTQAIILAAGKSTRTHPLTITRPKPLLAVAGTTLIEHNLEQLQGVVEEVIIIIGFKGDMIKQHLGDQYKNVRITYIEQTEQLGTAHALLQAEQKAEDKFIMMPGDDIFFKEDLQKLAREDFAVLVKKVENPQEFGVFLINDGKAEELIEKPQSFISNLASTSCFAFTKEIFPLLKSCEETERGEVEIPDAINKIIKERDIKIIETKRWVPVTYAWNLLDANKAIIDAKTAGAVNTIIQGTVEEQVTIKGDVIIGENTIIKSGTYIEGPVIIGKNCIVGPNAYIRPYSTISDGCKVGNAVEIKNTILGKNTNVVHLSYIGDSILGEKVNMGGGCITANLRHDERTVRTPVKGKMVDTKRRKLGTIIGDKVHTGIHTTIYPGRKLWPHTTTMPGEVVKHDKNEGYEN